MKARRRRGQFPKPTKENGQWKIRYWTDVAQEDGTVRRVRKTKCLGRVEDMTLTEARKEAQRFLQPINDVEPQVQHSDKTLNDLISRWRVAVKPNLRLSTQANYEWAYERARKVFGQLSVSDLEKADVQQYLTDAARNLSPESVRDLRARLRALLSLAEEWNWISPGTNPAAGRLRLPSRAPVRERRIPTPVQFRELVSALPWPYRAIVCLAGLGGLRRGELAALRWNDLGNRTVRIDEAVYRGHLGPPKTPKSRRTVTVPRKVMELLAEWRSECSFMAPEDFVFSIRTNSPIDLNRALERVVKPTEERLGLPRFSWQDFRHAYTTWGRKAGVEAEVMRDQVGHTSVLMTQDVYSHLDDDQGEAAERIGDFVWPESGCEAA